MTREGAKRLLTKEGYDVFEQRGFYSHFLRVRSLPSYATVTTINVDADNCVADKDVLPLVAKGKKRA